MKNVEMYISTSHEDVQRPSHCCNLNASLTFATAAVESELGDSCVGR